MWTIPWIHWYDANCALMIYTLCQLLKIVFNYEIISTIRHVNRVIYDVTVAVGKCVSLPMYTAHTHWEGIGAYLPDRYCYKLLWGIHCRKYVRQREGV